MLKAGVYIDSWKLPIFKKHLDRAGYQYSEHPGITEGTLTLTVMTTSVLHLKPVIEAANEEAKHGKPQ